MMITQNKKREMIATALAGKSRETIKEDRLKELAMLFK